MSPSLPRSSRGSLLIITLWMVTILSVLAIATARFLSLEVRMARYRMSREQARTIARSGVYLAMQRLLSDLEAPEAGGGAYDWLADEWALIPQEKPPEDPAQWVIPLFPTESQDSGSLSVWASVRIIDADRRLDLNGADYDQLLRLIGDEKLAQAIIDARDAPEALENLPDAQPPYFAKNGPFVAAEELSELPGMTPEAYALLRAHTTPYTREGEAINLNTVGPEVLRAIGLSESAVQLILQFREGPDGPEAHGEDGIFTQPGVAILQKLKDTQGVDLTGTADGNYLISDRFGVSSRVFVIRSEGATAHPPLRVHVEAVVRRSACDQGLSSPCIVAWREG